MSDRGKSDRTARFNWTGREDREDGPLGRRMHHIVSNITAEELPESGVGLSFLGFACDAGVKRNKGRTGARKGPDGIRAALANMAWHQKAAIADLGNIYCEEDNLEASQFAAAEVISAALQHGPVITLGGGHEVAWASFQGLVKALGKSEPSIGIINFDAHFDLREFQSHEPGVSPSSGTPFYQAAHWCRENNRPFHYACLGVSRASNTATLFERADALGVWYLEDDTFYLNRQQTQLEELSCFLDKCDIIYLTIDLDVFPAAAAPGVSAPAARGVGYDALAPFFHRILRESHKCVLADIAEYNPDFDIDNQTARLAARLCWDIAESLIQSGPLVDRLTS